MDNATIMQPVLSLREDFCRWLLADEKLLTARSRYLSRIITQTAEAEGIRPSFCLPENAGRWKSICFAHEANE